MAEEKKPAAKAAAKPAAKTTAAKPAAAKAPAKPAADGQQGEEGVQPGGQVHAMGEEQGDKQQIQNNPQGPAFDPFLRHPHLGDQAEGTQGGILPGGGCIGEGGHQVTQHDGTQTARREAEQQANAVSWCYYDGVIILKFLLGRG